MFFYPSSTCRIDIPRLILVPSAHTRCGWGWLKKLESMALSCAKYWMAVRAAFLGRLHFLAYPFLLAQIFYIFSQVVSIPFLPFLPRRLWIGQGLNRPRLYPNAILYLHYRAWAITFLGLSLWAQRINGAGPNIVGPHNSPSKPCCPTSWLERRVLVIPSLYYGSFNSAFH